MESFFGGSTGGPKRRTYERGADLETIQEITMEDAFRGASRTLHTKTLVRCEACKGKGGDESVGTATCAVCGGNGQIREQRRTFFGSFSQIKTCEKCRGAGKVPNKICAKCNGAGRVKAERDIVLEILPGVQDNQVIKIQGGGEAGEGGTPAGDLYIHVRVKPHQIFARKNDDLFIKKELNIWDVLLGRKLEISTIGGNKLHVEIPPGFNLKENLRIPGEGMPRFGGYGRGDLFVDFTAKTPKKISAKVKKLLEDLEGEL